MTLTLDEALALAAAVRDAARAEGMEVVAAITDPAGHLLALTRMDGAFPGAIEAATAKARCAALYRRPTSAFAQAHRDGRPVAFLPNVIPLGGGLPVSRGGTIIGALGVSGAVEATETALAERLVADFEARAQGV